MTARWTPRFDTGWSDGVVPAAPMAFKIFKSKETAAAWGVAAVAMVGFDFVPLFDTAEYREIRIERFAG